MSHYSTKLISIFSLITLLLSACSRPATPYAAPFSNINSLKKISIHSKPIALGNFTDSKNTRAISCRLDGNETLPGNVEYVDYLKSALEEELNAADLYAANSAIKLDATLDTINFNSFQGKWNIAMTFNDHRQTPYSIKSSYSFPVEFIADVACNQAAQAFMPAVQNFLHVLYADKHFIQSLNNK